MDRFRIVARLGAVALAIAASAGISACGPTTGSASLPAGSLPAAATATPPPETGAPTGQPGDDVVVTLGEQVDLEVGDRASIDATEVTFELLAASGPGEGCNDCPNQVLLGVDCPPQHEELDIAFSGGMEEAALERARQGESCDVTFYVVEVHDGRASVRVDRPA